MKKHISLLLCILIPSIVLLMPTSALPIDGLTTVEHRLIALFVFATLFWIAEPIPIFATSVLIIVLQLLLVSDQSLFWLRGSADDPSFGTPLEYKSIMATFASPIIMLFLGGFFLAMAATKYRLDINLARVLLKPFGNRPQTVLLGLMGVTALFSMFMSNTATTAMMLAILAPILGSFDSGDRGRIGFALAIPFAANVGGIGTPIGTPPNAIALKYLTGDIAISFGEWMAFAVPFVVVMLLFTWKLLVWLFPPQTNCIELTIESRFLRNWKAYIVYLTFALTIFMWLFDFTHGMNSYVVAMIPVAIFSATTIITKEDLKRINWDVLWLVAGGIALGVGLEKSGAAKSVVESIPFSALSPYSIVLLATVTTILMGSAMSHTATANLLLPLMAVLAASVSSLSPLGGAQMLLLAVTFAASLAMPLPISTPPNALAHATGYLETKHMIRSGVIVGVVGLAATYILMFILKTVGYF